MKAKTMPQKTQNVEKTRFMFVSSLVLFAISVVLLTAAVYSAVPHKTRQAVYQPGTEIVNGQAKFSIKNLTYTNGEGRFVAPANKHYAIFDFTVENTSSKTIAILPANDTYMKNTAGVVSFLTPYGLENPFRAGDLLPHEKITGQLSYLVNKNESQKLYVDAVWSGALIAIAIN
jgi:hypothetical protein